MMLVLHEKPGYVVVTASGKLKSEDYDRFIPEFERVARERGKVPMMIDATTFQGWDLQGLWQDLKFDATHQDALGPMAVVGHSRWEEWAVKIARPFFKAEVRFYRPDQIDEARHWLLQVGQLDAA